MSNLTPEQMDKFRSILVEAVDQHLAKGGKVVHRSYNDHKGGCCPMTCLLNLNVLEASPSRARDAAMVLTKMLGVEISPVDIWDFIIGFDDAGPIIPDGKSALRLLGQELYEKYLGIKE